MATSCKLTIKLRSLTWLLKIYSRFQLHSGRILISPFRHPKMFILNVFKLDFLLYSNKLSSFSFLRFFSTAHDTKIRIQCCSDESYLFNVVALKFKIILLNAKIHFNRTLTCSFASRSTANVFFAIFSLALFFSSLRTPT